MSRKVRSPCSFHAEVRNGASRMINRLIVPQLGADVPSTIFAPASSSAIKTACNACESSGFISLAQRQRSRAPIRRCCGPPCSFRVQLLVRIMALAEPPKRLSWSGMGDCLFLVIRPSIASHCIDLALWVSNFRQLDHDYHSQDDRN